MINRTSYYLKNSEAIFECLENTKVCHNLCCLNKLKNSEASRIYLLNININISNMQNRIEFIILILFLLIFLNIYIYILYINIINKIIYI